MRWKSRVDRETLEVSTCFSLGCTFLLGSISCKLKMEGPLQALGCAGVAYHCSILACTSGTILTRLS
jgi:hypothetical protein